MGDRPAKGSPPRQWGDPAECMTSRHTRSNAQGPLHQLTNEELARLERQNRQLPIPTTTNMGDHQDDLTAAFALMQQQMQQTIQANDANQRNAPEEVDQLIKNNQNHVFIMEESPQDKGTAYITSEADQATEDHHEVSYVNGQGWQFKNYHPNPNVRNNPHLFNNPKPDGNAENAQGNQVQNNGYQRGYGNQGRTFVLSPAQNTQFHNQKQPTNQQPTQPAQTAPQDEMKSLANMMSQLLQRQQIQGKSLNQNNLLWLFNQLQNLSPPPPPPRDYVPKVPYLVPAKATRKDKEDMKCRKMLEDLTVRLPLMTLIRAEAEQNVQNIDAEGYAKMLDSARTMERLVAYLNILTKSLAVKSCSNLNRTTKYRLSEGQRHVSNSAADKLEYGNRTTDKPSSIDTRRPSMHTARSLRSERASVPLGRYVATKLEPSSRPSVRSVRSLRSDRTLPKRRYDTKSCILVYPTMLSPEDRSELSSCLSTILRHQSNFAVKTAESSFFIERSRNKRFESEDGPKGPRTRLEAQLTIS
ncbi:hypothetical protein IGI04_036273 [Brassica rapa subsp. trilocularis]|uniref:Uncharacterized protein n=1 Tax=Brassica rapa subsp. trilocularis TaxID=1813537 RepID=A0ABQ7LE42_BRACM|nr:hypothetical protein IGI04_036273 [Brassica rapa subsp. trilocularis]